MWKKLYELGSTGSEGGLVLEDEEYKSACRITLEKCPRHYAITSGVYGGMVHTAFANSDDYMTKYLAMKQELQNFIDKNITGDEEIDFYEYFTNKY